MRAHTHTYTNIGGMQQLCPSYHHTRASRSSYKKHSGKSDHLHFKIIIKCHKTTNKNNAYSLSFKKKIDFSIYLEKLLWIHKLSNQSTVTINQFYSAPCPKIITRQVEVTVSGVEEKEKGWIKSKGRKWGGGVGGRSTPNSFPCTIITAIQ